MSDNKPPPTKVSPPESKPLKIRTTPPPENNLRGYFRNLFNLYKSNFSNYITSSSLLKSNTKLYMVFIKNTRNF